MNPINFFFSAAQITSSGVNSFYISTALATIVGSGAYFLYKRSMKTPYISYQLPDPDERAMSCWQFRGTVLDLSRTGITEIPSIVFSIKTLQYLCLDETGLTTLPPEIAELENLGCLDCRANPITAVPSVINQMPNLREICFVNCPIEIVEEGVYQASSDITIELEVTLELRQSINRVVCQEGYKGPSFIFANDFVPDFTLSNA